MPNNVNIQALTQEAHAYEPVLQMLPFDTLEAGLSPLGINVIDVKEKNTIVSFERRGGLVRPYTAGSPDDDIDVGEIGKGTERTLDVEKAVLALRDHIANYNQTVVVGGQTAADNSSKKHPLERIILEAVVKTIGEDILDAAFHMKRDPLDLTPMGIADGFNTIIDDDIAANNITTGLGNLKNTGAIVMPNNDSDAIDIVVDFIRSAHPQLRKRGVLMIDPTTLYYVMKAMEYKVTNHQVINFQTVVDYLKSVCFTPNLQIVTADCLGSGGRLILSAPGNFDLGLRTKTDTQFIQVRTPYKDPNWVQFWGQFEIGTRIRSIHPKMFMVNDQTNTAIELAGDYRTS
jgi:hypothetical protein